QALEVVRQDRSGDLQPVGYIDFVGVALPPSGDRTEQRQADKPVVRSRRKHQGRSAAGLLVAGLRVEIQPNGVSAVRGVIGFSGRLFRGAAGYHASPPTGGPVLTSPWRFASVIPFRSWERVYFRGTSFLRIRSSVSLSRTISTEQSAKSRNRVTR